jgi:hypothetical protein
MQRLGELTSRHLFKTGDHFRRVDTALLEQVLKFQEELVRRVDVGHRSMRLCIDDGKMLAAGA